MAYKSGSANIIFSDFPDLDVIRVDDTYYMVSTTMHFFPGCVILRSYNLLDWEFCSYVYEKLDSTRGQTLKDNCGVYGKGMWAASLRYNNGIFYVSFVCNDTHKTYLYTSNKIEGPWKKSEILGFYHDMSILFDDDGGVFVVSGNTEIYLTQMKPDLSGPLVDGIQKIIIADDKENVILGYEGCHFYKINGKYYIFMIHMPKGKMRTQACYVADCVEGPYFGGDVLCADLGGWNSGVAQGGIVQAVDGKWFGILFQDHGALGRIPVLVPVEFNDDGFPVFGQACNDIDSVDQNTTKSLHKTLSQTVTVFDSKPDYKYLPLYSNDFTNSAWQWNHQVETKLVDRTPNCLKITTNKIVTNITQAASTLTQRTFTENCAGSVILDATNIKNGDFAGLCALEGEYAFIGITKKDEKFYLVTAEHKIPYSPWTMGVFNKQEPVILQELPFDGGKITLKLDFKLGRQNQTVELMYFDKNFAEFKTLNECKLRYTLDQFVGVRFALFMYSTLEAGGQAEFTDFKYILN